MEMQNFSETINIISYAATMELNIENVRINYESMLFRLHIYFLTFVLFTLIPQQLKNISHIWKETNLEMYAHIRMKGVYSLRAVDDVFQILEEHQVVLSSMKSSKLVIFELPSLSSFSVCLLNTTDL